MVLSLRLRGGARHDRRELLTALSHRLLAQPLKSVNRFSLLSGCRRVRFASVEALPEWTGSARKRKHAVFSGVHPNPGCGGQQC